ncbi:MAG: hypothetical protein R2941_13200 [Desulfobacterales bacterium]
MKIILKSCFLAVTVLLCVCATVVAEDFVFHGDFGSYETNGGTFSKLVKVFKDIRSSQTAYRFYIVSCGQRVLQSPSVLTMTAICGQWDIWGRRRPITLCQQMHRLDRLVF